MKTAILKFKANTTLDIIDSYKIIIAKHVTLDTELVDRQIEVPIQSNRDVAKVLNAMTNRLLDSTNEHNEHLDSITIV